MNYKKIYDDLMNRACSRQLIGYVEHHHIVPRCMGGTNDRNNIVILTPEEHFLAHLLLVKINPGNLSLLNAASIMTGHSTTDKRNNNKMFGWLRRRMSASYKEYYKLNPRSTEWRETHSKWNSTYWTPERRIAHGALTKGNNGGKVSKNTVNVTDKKGLSKRIPKIDYDRMDRPTDITQWEYVSVTSKESKRRKEHTLGS
jgi:hypothetical protein